MQAQKYSRNLLLVSGQKFRHGHTFGDSTIDAKRTAAEAAANVY